MTEYIVETKNLIKTYTSGGRPLEVLKGVDLKVEHGEFMAIMGPSGSGKSTLLNMIGALDTPTSGDVFINNVNINTLNDNQKADLRNREVGFIFQFFNQPFYCPHSVFLCFVKIVWSCTHFPWFDIVSSFFECQIWRIIMVC